MKNIKINIKIVMICLTLAVVMLNLGIYIGRAGIDDSISVSVEKKQNHTGKLNINKASVSEFSQLPGISDAIGRRIVAYREENGKFSSIFDLLNISGISENTLETIDDYIYCEG